ncbi:MAG: hypothetical protein V2A65_00430 [Candidatus Omnitrophota bacterium]
MTNSKEGSGWQIRYPDDFVELVKRAFNKKEQVKILTKVEELVPLQNPLIHPQVIPLMEQRLRGKYRMKFGDIRIVFSLDTKERVIQVELIARRKDATYKRLSH